MYQQNGPLGMNQPMDNWQFMQCLEGQLQAMELNDPQELREIARHHRAMERDVHKSQLKLQETVEKQMMRAKKQEIQANEEGVLLVELNGENKILRKNKLFDCKIIELWHFRRDGSDARFWQVAIQTAGEKIYSPLYPAEDLQSINKLKKTLLSQFSCAVRIDDKSTAWSWMQKQLSAQFGEKKEIVLPSLAGWFQLYEKWFFCTQSADIKFMANEIINRFAANSLKCDNVDEIVDGLTKVMGETGNLAALGVLLIYRLLALFARLTIDSPPPMGLTLIGNNAVKLAEDLLSTMQCKDRGNIINLDSDRINQIRKNLKDMQDSPFIFVSTNMDGKSVSNRVREIISWLDSGIMEGKKITFPFIFCLQRISPMFPLDSTIVLSVDDCQVTNGFETFAKLQFYIISQVENGGIYWVKEFRNQYDRLREELQNEEVKPILHISKAVTSTVLKMLGLEGERRKVLQNIFDHGLDEIKQQIFADSSVLVEIFKEKVIQLVDSEILVVVKRQTDYLKTEKSVVYYDSDFYYFTTEILQVIVEKSGLSRSSILYIKRELAQMNVIRQYNKTSERRSEFFCDISVGSLNQKRVSAVKVIRGFWDEIGGIALYERSSE